MGLIEALDLIGTFVFALSGALAGANQRFDAFGAFVIAFVTAVGGGTLRDMMIGQTPVAWMNDTRYIYLILVALLCSYFFKRYVLKLRMTLFLFDAIGIGLFTILGVQKTLDMGLSPVVAVMMGTVSAVFGGVIRDVLCNIPPLIFRKEIYATACIVGGIIYLALTPVMPESLAMTITIVSIIVFRLFAVKKKWALPVIE